MSKVKVKKEDTFIDMTAMSDVTVLLLTFFMLTSTFIKKEPVQVTTPGSVSDIKIPEVNIMTVLIEKSGQVYMSLDNPEDKMKVLDKVGKEYKIEFTTDELAKFAQAPAFGVPIGRMKEFLALTPEKQDEVIPTLKGIPYDSVNNQFKVWVKCIKEVTAYKENDMTYAIKADNATSYSDIKSIMNTLQDLRINRYNLITSLKGNADSPSEN